MRKLLLVIAIIVPSLAGAGDYFKTSESQIFTRADPSGTPTTTFAVPLFQVRGFRVKVCAEAAQTLTNVTLKAWHYDVWSGLWGVNPALQLTATSVGQRCITFPDQSVSDSAAGEWFMYASSGTTASGGTTVTVYYTAWME